MNSPAHSPRISSYEIALQDLLTPLAPVAPKPVPLSEASGLIAAGDERVAVAIPSMPLARIDGWACDASSLIGASAMSPVMLAAPLAWVEVGQALPSGCDAILPPDMIERGGPLWLALGETLPGEGVLRSGEWLASGSAPLRAGQTIGALDLMLAEAAGLTTVLCRVPRVMLVDVGAQAAGISSRLVAHWLASTGARVETVVSQARDADAIGQLLAGALADLVVVIGGTGRGVRDATAGGIARAGRLVAHGVGLSSAPTLTPGWLGECPVVGLPGAPEAAMAGCLAFLYPVMTCLTGRATVPPLRLPLLRKVSSVVGQAELALFAREDAGWMPLAIGTVTPDHFRLADGWTIIASGDEGYPMGAMLDVGPLEGWRSP